MGTPGQLVSLLGQVLSTVLVTVAVAGGGAVVLPDLLRGAGSERWPAAPGEIVGWQRLSPPRVHYRYRVGKQVFVGDRVAFGWNEGTGLEAHAERLMARYPVGRTVEIRYHPERPDEAVLAPGVRSEIGAGFAILAVFAVCWTMMMISLVQRLFRVEDPLFGAMTPDTGDGYSFEPVTTKRGKAAWAAFLAALFGTLASAMGLGVPTIAFDWPGWIPVIVTLVTALVAPAVVWWRRQDGAGDPG